MELIDKKKLLDEIERRKLNGKSYYHAMLVLLDIIASIPEEKPSEDLEQEIAGMYQALFGTDIINRKEMLYIETFETIARHFAQWQKEQDEKGTSDLLTIAHLQGADQMKEQMMKDAVDGKVVIGYSAYVKETNNDALKQYIIDNFKDGDKVKVIIVKEGSK